MKKSQAVELLERLNGHSFNGFRLTHAVGTGATAAVYKATDANGETVAVKIYDAQFADEERLNRELTLRGHNCNHLVKVHDGGRQTVDDTGLLFLVMEFVDGKELTRLRDRPTPLPDAEVRRILHELCLACAFLLERDLCHRDIKTQNIKLRSNGDVVLLDMGVLRPVGDSDLTQEGRNVATRRYSPPELQHRREEVDASGLEAITVYQVGAVIYELIQRTKLFATVPDHPDATLSRAIDTELPRFIGASVGADLCEVVLRCLLKDWRSRPRLKDLFEVAASTQTADHSEIKARVYRSRLAAAEIKAAQDAANAHFELLQDMLRTAIQLVRDAISVPELVHPEIKVVDRRRDTWVVGTFPHNLENGFPTVLLIALALSTRTADSALIVKGCGMFGNSFMPSAAQFPQAFLKEVPGRAPEETAEFLSIFEPIWELPLDSETLSVKVNGWANNLIEEYFRQTEECLTRTVEHHKADAEARIRGTPQRTSAPMVNPTIFNLTAKRAVQPRSWKAAN